MKRLVHARVAPLLLVVAVLVLSFVQVQCAGPRDLRVEAMTAVFDGQHTYMGDPGPSVVAAERLAKSRQARVYDGDLSHGSAFIYPPLAAVLYRPLVGLWSIEVVHRLMLANHLLFVVILLVLLRLGARDGRLQWREAAGTIAAMALYFPLLHALQLNQSMVLATALLGLVWLGVDGGRDRLAGVALACAFLVKPQLALMLPLLWWHARPLVWAALATSMALLAASLAYAGWHNHVDYATHVLPTLSRGYAYFANQSWSGLVLRWFAGDDYADLELPPRRTAVQVIAGIAQLVTYAAAVLLVRRAPRHAASRLGVLGLAWLAVTLASPISWQHHYAPAIFVAMVLWRERATASVAVRWLGAAGFALVAAYFEVRQLRAPVARLAASYVFAGGGLLAVALVLRLRAGAPPPDQGSGVAGASA